VALLTEIDEAAFGVSCCTNTMRHSVPKYFLAILVR